MLCCLQKRWLIAFVLALTGCNAEARLIGQPAPLLPLPAGIEVAFNHNPRHRYRSPVHGSWRQGDDLEAFLLESIQGAEQEILMAVQELSLPRIAEALVAKHQAGVTVQLVLENSYSTPWSEQHPADLTPRGRHRLAQMQALGHGDALAILQKGGVPMLDDTADASAGSGLMHHKFLVVDGQVVTTGSANFSPSGLHGDPEDQRSRGNVNHLLRLHSPDLAALFREEFLRMWGDGPGGVQDSLFGLAKRAGPMRWTQVGEVTVGVLFAPHRRNDPNNGLDLLLKQLKTTRQRADLALFVLSDQRLGNRLGDLHDRGVAIRLLADSSFASRSYSEVLDLLAVELPDHRCRIEADNQPRRQAIEGIGIPKLSGGDKLHHKLAVLDDSRVITGSFNWSPAAAHQNDETLLVIHSPVLAAHFRAEIDRLWRGAELGVSRRLAQKREQQRQRCGSGRPLKS